MQNNTMQIISITSLQIIINNMVEDSPADWLYDYTLQFLASPGWKIPILSFIDEKCCAFDTEDENKFEYTEIHKVIFI